MQMHPQTKRKRNTAGIGVVIAVLLLCELASMIVLCGRIVSYTEAKFVNVLSLTEERAPNIAAPAPVNSADSAETSSPGAESTSAEESGTDSVGSSGAKKPEFHMEAEAEIFRLSYDNESGKTTVIGAAGNSDKLIAPGTTNLYQFTLANTGDVSLDYTLTMEAYVTGTDLRIPVNARVWDYTNKYLVGSADGMVDVMELNTVEESAELGAGRYAVYNLEWEWPFERADENGDITSGDTYDTMLGNLAVDEDLVLHIVIRTYAEYDENPDDPNAGVPKPPQTGDDAPIVLLIVLCAGSFVGLCVMFFAFFKSGRKEKQEAKT